MFITKLNEYVFTLQSTGKLIYNNFIYRILKIAIMKIQQTLFSHNKEGKPIKYVNTRFYHPIGDVHRWCPIIGGGVIT